MVVKLNYEKNLVIFVKLTVELKAFGLKLDSIKSSKCIKSTTIKFLCTYNINMSKFFYFLL